MILDCRFPGSKLRRARAPAAAAFCAGSGAAPARAPGPTIRAQHCPRRGSSQKILTQVKKLGMAGDEMEPARSKNAYVRGTGYVCLGREGERGQEKQIPPLRLRSGSE